MTDAIRDRPWGRGEHETPLEPRHWPPQPVIATRLPMSESARAIVKAALEDSVSEGWLRFVAWSAGTAMLIGSALIGWRPSAATVGLLILGAVCVVAVLEAMSTLSIRRELQRDLRSGEIVRSVGPLRAVAHGGGEDPVLWSVDLGKRALRSPWRGQEPPFAELLGAQVDETPHARLVLEIRDRDGLQVFRRGGYQHDASS